MRMRAWHGVGSAHAISLEPNNCASYIQREDIIRWSITILLSNQTLMLVCRPVLWLFHHSPHAHMIRLDERDRADEISYICLIISRHKSNLQINTVRIELDDANNWDVAVRGFSETDKETWNGLCPMSDTPMLSGLSVRSCDQTRPHHLPSDLEACWNIARDC